MIVRFDDCEVDFDRVEIRRSGVPIPVQPQVFAVIAYLIERTDRVVPKVELLDNIWGDRFVSESALTSRIKSARRALGDDGVTQRVIRTVQGHGYRFAAGVTVVDGPARSPRNGTVADPFGTDPLITSAAGPVDRSPSGAGPWPFVGRHDEIEWVRNWYAEQAVCGVIVDGPDRVGRSRFAEECGRHIGANGARVERVVGLSSSADIPLAALAHLLPPEVHETGHSAADLARAAVLRRAQSAFEAVTADGPRPVLVVDDVHDLDSMSGALLTAWFTTGSAFGIIVRRNRSADEGTLGELVRHDRFRHVTLEALDEIDVDILLYRALEGPIDPTSLLQLYEASQGRVGLLRDVVAASERAGVLRREAGVWRLVGRPVSRTTQDWPMGGLTDEAIGAAERLALFPRLELGLCHDVMGSRALEQLDRSRLLDLGMHDGVQFVRLADPLLAGVVIESIGPLRLRAVKRELVTRLANAEPDPVTLATLVSWGSEFIDDVDEASRRAAALTAMLRGDLRSAQTLVESLVPTDDPYVGLMQGELAVRYGQWELAEDLLGAIDVDGLDDHSASLVLRRRAAVQFIFRRRQEGAIEWLEREGADRGGSVARDLQVRRLSYLSLLGRYEEVLASAVPTDGVRGITEIELRVALASAHLGRGAIDEALVLCTAASTELERLPPVWSVEPRDGVTAVHCSALLQRGDIDDAATLARTSTARGRHSEFAHLPALAAEIELERGRPWAAREILRTAIASSSRHTKPQWLVVAEAVFARTDVELGQLRAARNGLDAAFVALAETSGPVRWRLLRSVGELCLSLDRADEALPLLLDGADDAERTGATLAAADLLCTASWIDPTPATAGLVAERIGDLAGGFGGRLWPVRIAHARDLGSGRDLDDTIRRYREIGFLRLADLAGRASRHRV